ncbi:Pimeloyl-ACP methyl ester carboxylesterase [Paenibacillus tianmuensis]|uniref:Pimeloyl-ACP methyl ester carboxylesterase n=2 Tax=Paenibacillus tianmuensis TaxID=624147 RepID=A0A1G4R5H4_9BACL|nr:Pimeloyl-ACP methyl ester carboxylesterase [Paenibacillus tianmuensis]
MSFFISADSLMYYELYECPAKGAKTLVMIHSAGLNSTFWQSIVPLLEWRYTILLYDLNGHGQSSERHTDISWEPLTGELHALLHFLRLERVTLLGHDFGAHLAIQFASAYGSMVESLILISPFAHLPLIALHKEYKLRISLAKKLARPTLGEAMAKRMSVKHMDTVLRQRIVQAFERVHFPTYVQMLELATKPVFLKDYLVLQKPSLLLSGEQDPVFTPALAGLTHTQLETTAFLVVPDASSLVFVDQPIYSSDWIDAFIRKPFPGQRNNAINRELRQHVRQLSKQGYEHWSGNRIRIRCLGKFEVCLNDRILPDGWNTRYAKSLMIYLAFHPTATREQLCEALFPEVEHPNAMRNLRVYLSHFSKLLETNDTEKPCVTIGRDVVKLHYLVNCDLMEFLNDLQQVAAEQDNEVKYGLCEDLLSRLSGKLMPGCYDPFALSLKEKVEQLWEGITLWAADYCMLTERSSQAIPFLLSGLQHGMADETLYYDRLISIYQQNGNAKELRKWVRKKRSSLSAPPAEEKL